MILWGVRVLAFRMFGSIKNFFMQKRGYGNLYIFQPGNKLSRHYVKLTKADKQIEINERKYTIIPEKMFSDDMGIDSLLYYLEDTEPMTPKEKDRSDNMIRSASFWSNLGNMIKMYAELKAAKQAGLIVLLLVCVLIGVFIVLAMNGYLIYELTSGTGSILGI
jgi:hypothetical protein